MWWIVSLSMFKRWTCVVFIYDNVLALCHYLFRWCVACNAFNYDVMLIMRCYDLCIDVNFQMKKKIHLPIVLHLCHNGEVVTLHFIWKSMKHEMFKIIRGWVSPIHVLVLFGTNQNFKIEVHALWQLMVTILMQYWRPIAYRSKTFLSIVMNHLILWLGDVCVGPSSEDLVTSFCW